MMHDDLLAYFERELVTFRNLCREYAARYPRIAGNLHMAGDMRGDPHVERMIEAFALIAARISKRLDDDYPQFTELLLGALMPHYLQTFPSAAIACLDIDEAARKEMTEVHTIPRGTEMVSAPVQGVPCTFRTSYEINAVPAAFSAVRFDAVIHSPGAIRLPPEVTSCISITLQGTSTKLRLADLKHDSLRVFIDGEPSFCAAVRDALFMRCACACVEAGDGTWRPLSRMPLTPAGFSENDALIPFPERSHPAYRVLTEYFAFPDKFNFFDIDLAALRPHMDRAGDRVTLHLALAGLNADSDTARMLSSLAPASLLLGCSPVVNLFRRPGVPIRVSHQTTDYAVLADAAHPHVFEVYSVDSVYVLGQSHNLETVREFRPFYAMRHGEDENRKGSYFVLRRDETLALHNAGHERRISFVDTDFHPLTIEKVTVSLELTCTNRSLPARLNCGLPGGDLNTPAYTGRGSIRLLRRPTMPSRFAGGIASQWRLISHLSLNHHSLVQEGLPALREMLTLYDLPQSAISQRQIRGIVGLSHQSSTAWIRSPRGASLVHGIEVRVILDEHAFVGSGIHLFAQVLDQFLGLYVQLNSFTELVVISDQSGEELIRCMPRNGNVLPV